MCITFGKASLSNTIVYSGEAALDGKRVHILGYQNRAENEEEGPNAMILPFPTEVEMTPENVIDSSGCTDILKKYAEVLQPRMRSRSLSLNYSAAAAAVHVFDTGSYTVVLSKSVVDIYKALPQVPENRRPKVDIKFLARYSTLYPKQPIALCCFDGSFDSEPLFWWYEPKDPSILFAPALDAHGEPPDPNASVWVDHTIIFGSAIDQKVGMNIPQWNNCPDHIKSILSPLSWGKAYRGMMQNGDFYCQTSALKDKNNQYSERMSIWRVPPSAKV